MAITQWVYWVRTTYKTRFGTEPIFGDFKEGGFRLSQSRLEHEERISRLFLAVSSSYIWMISLGVRLFAWGDASTVAPAHRRNLSIFETGWQDSSVDEYLPISEPFSAGDGLNENFNSD